MGQRSPGHAGGARRGIFWDHTFFTFPQQFRVWDGRLAPSLFLAELASGSVVTDILKESPMLAGMVSSGGVVMSSFAHTIYQNKYAHSTAAGKETWPETAERVAKSVMGDYLPGMVAKVQKYITERKLMPGGRYLYAAGRRFPQISNCFLLKAEDSREGWGSLCNKSANALMTGGGIGVVYSDIRSYGLETRGMGGIATGPCSLMGILNEQGRRIMQGGSRRSAIWAGVHWWHPDIPKYIRMKNWPEIVKQAKAADFNFPGEMDMTNISVILDDDFFAAYSDPTWNKTYYKWGTSWNLTHRDAQKVYWDCVTGMLTAGEPGFSIDIGTHSKENLRNACVEAVSEDDCDNCNLASMNLARIESGDEFEDVMEAGIALLICGTLSGKLPLEEMYKVREKNRRLGLGLMGLHEWLLMRGMPYGESNELADWLKIYANSTKTANRLNDKLGISRSVATRSVAPVGTISIVAETTSGIEPIMAAAYKRRYLDGVNWKAQYVIDASAQRIVEKGVDPDLIEDSLSLSEDVERRMKFQAWVQTHVDQGISSTINLPPWGSSLNNENTVKKFGDTLFKYLPSLRGITTYPDGSRGGQPITRVPYSEAINKTGVEFVDNSEASCNNGVCGS